MKPLHPARGSRGLRQLLPLTLLLLPLLAAVPGASAQGGATVSGRVTDPAGVGIEGATVQLRGSSGGEVRVQSTGRGGGYRFAEVAPGSYVLTVGRDGFREATSPLTVAGPRAYVMDLDLEQVFVLERLVVTGTRSAQAVGRVAAAVSVVDKDRIQAGEKAINLEESLRRVAGVRVEDELGSGYRTRIIVRGAGTRANSPAGSGVRGVKVLVDGIPKNNAGGSAQDLINIDLESIGRIEVLKGPSSALYGNQSGGVVNLITEVPPATPALEYRQLLGSYGLAREHVQLGGRNDRFSYLVSGFRTDMEGHREQSRFNSTGFHSRLGFVIDELTTLTAVLGYDRSFQETPGPLTAAQFAANPKQADQVFAQNDVHAVVDEMRLGVTYSRRELLGRDELELTGYYVPRHLGPFQQIGVRIPQHFMNRGTNVRYTNAAPVGALASRLSVGVDFQSTPITTGVFNSQTGAAISELEENATTYGVYLLEELHLTESLLLSVGGRFDNVHFSSRNLMRAGAPKAARTFERATPKLGLTFLPSPAFSAYATYSRGFETPIIGELRVLPGGAFGFNDELDPQTSVNYEVGARGQPWRWLSFESAVYWQDVKDMINPIGTFPNNSFQNVGRVDQFGVELTGELRPVPSTSLALSYTFSDFVIEEFRDGRRDFSGMRLPGVPRHSLFGEAGYRHRSGLAGAVNLDHVGRFYFDNANSASNDPYTVVNLRASYATRIGGRRVAPFLGINNLTDEKYSAFALINDTRQRFYNPLPGTHAFGGVSITF